MRFWGCRSGGWVWGTAMDSTALHELIAQVRGTAAALAEAEQRVASFTAELAQQDRLAQPDAKPAQPAGSHPELPRFAMGVRIC